MNCLKCDKETANPKFCSTSCVVHPARGGSVIISYDSYIGNTTHQIDVRYRRYHLCGEVDDAL